METALHPLMRKPYTYATPCHKTTAINRLHRTDRTARGAESSGGQHAGRTVAWGTDHEPTAGGIGTVHSAGMATYGTADAMCRSNIADFVRSVIADR